jgi:excisionase family DNA binding protein
MTTFLTSQELQDLINVDRSTVYRMAEDGRLPAVKVGRQWRFPADRIYEQFGLASLGRTSSGAGRTITGSPDGPSAPTVADSATVRLADLLRVEVAQSVADLIGEVFGTMAVITDMEGRPLTSVANPCGYYVAIADGNGAGEACRNEWHLFASEPHVAPRFVPTHLGFLCARTFVWVDLKPVGMIVVGGVTPPVWPPPRERLEAIAAEFGAPIELLLSSLDQTWDIDPVEQRRILRLLPQMGDLVSQLATTRNQLLDTSQEGERT